MAIITLEDGERSRLQVHAISYEPTRTSAIRSGPDLEPLDPDVVSQSIPAFFIGRNRAGFWVARESRGRFGGLFRFKRSAVDFARTASEPLHCALIFPSDTFELDSRTAAIL